MKDSQETNLPMEGKLEEAKMPVTTPENTVEEIVINTINTESITEEAVASTNKLSKGEILEKLATLVETTTEATRNEVEALKQAFYKIHRNEIEELKKAFLENGGEETNFVAPEDETENRLKELLTSYK